MEYVYYRKNRNSPEFLFYLEELYKKKKYDKLIRVIKISGIYISYDFRKTSKTQRENVTNFLNQNLRHVIPNKVEKLFSEISVLKKFKNDVLKKSRRKL
ncbi:hypothetical protein P9166_14495 [Lactococcus lactis]|nr:hypothetical protein P9166_14495 [Lactococcus lactis]